MHAALAEIIQCPKCRCAVSQRDPRDSQSLICSNPACTYADDGFPVVADAPVLIDFDQSVVTRSAVAGLDHVAARRHADNTPARWLYNFLTRTPGRRPPTRGRF